MAEQKNQDLNQLLKIRRDKLAELQANDGMISNGNCEPLLHSSSAGR